MGYRERIAALLNGKPVDRVPVWLWLLSSTFPARMVGYTMASSYNDPEKSFRAQILTRDMFQSDDIPRPSFGGAVRATWAFGGEIKMPTSDFDMAPSVVRYPVDSEEAAWKIAAPENVKESGAVPLFMKFARLQEQQGLPVSLHCDPPLETVRGICGLETLARWLIKKPDLVHRLLRIATDYQLAVLRYWVETFGPGNILPQIPAPTASNQVISPKQFEKFFFPYQKELHEKALSMGIKHFFCHICGDQNLNLPLWAEIPMGDISILSFGHEVDLATAIKWFGDKCIIAGNVEPAIIQTGSYQQVYDISKRCIEAAKYSPKGFILVAGCALPPMAPPYNVFSMKKAVEDSGWY